MDTIRCAIMAQAAADLMSADETVPAAEKAAAWKRAETIWAAADVGGGWRRTRRALCGRAADYWASQAAAEAG